MAAEAPLAVREQDDDAAGAGDEAGAVDPGAQDLVRRAAKKPQRAVPRQRDRQLDGAFHSERPGRRAAVVRRRKQSAAGRNAAVIAVARADITQQRTRAQQRRRAVAADRISAGQALRRIEAPPALVGRSERRRVAVIAAVDAHGVTAGNHVGHQAVVDRPRARHKIAGRSSTGGFLSRQKLLHQLCQSLRRIDVMRQHDRRRCGCWRRRLPVAKVGEHVGAEIDRPGRKQAPSFDAAAVHPADA